MRSISFSSSPFLPLLFSFFLVGLRVNHYDFLHILSRVAACIFPFPLGSSQERDECSKGHRAAS